MLSVPFALALEWVRAICQLDFYLGQDTSFRHCVANLFWKVWR